MECNCSSYCFFFGDKNAKREMKKYKKKGLSKETGILFDELKSKVKNKSVTEVGSGIGLLAIDLTKQGAKNYKGYDISKPSINAAKDLTKREGLSKKLKYFELDYATHKGNLDSTDIILSDKVVCCYPDMEKFMQITAGKAGEYYAIIYPKRTIPAQIITEFAALLLKLTPQRGFRPFIHNTRII